jgi:hypothetical protein
MERAGPDYVQETSCKGLRRHQVPTGAEVSSARIVESVSPELICYWVSIKGLKRYFARNCGMGFAQEG